MIDFFIFILLSRESDGGVTQRTNPDSFRSCPCFTVFRSSFVSDFLLFLLVRLHQAEIIIVKHLIQRRNNGARVGVEPSTCDYGRRKNDAPNHYAGGFQPGVRGLPSGLRMILRGAQRLKGPHFFLHYTHLHLISAGKLDVLTFFFHFWSSLDLGRKIERADLFFCLHLIFGGKLDVLTFFFFGLHLILDGKSHVGK